MKEIKEKIIKFIRRQASNKAVIIGLSGGLDSSVTAYLSVAALGKSKVYALIAPTDSNTKEDLKHAELIANLLEIEHEVITINNIIKTFQNSCDFFKGQKVVGNLKARVRMCLLYGLANATNSLIVGTGNKTEIMTGYFTKYGDGAVDFLPIGDLYKTEVKKLAVYLGIPEVIINKRPSAGLWDNQFDEEELGISYEKLDKILKAIENKKSLSKFNKFDVELVQNLIKNSSHKRKLPLICKIKI